MRLCVCECIYTERGATFSDPSRTVGVLIGYPVMSARFYLSEARTSPSCRGWHCVSGDLTRTFLPPSFRVVVCLRWCLFATRFFFSTTLPRPLFDTEIAQFCRNVTKYRTCVKAEAPTKFCTIAIRNSAAPRGCPRPRWQRWVGKKQHKRQ